MKVFHTVNQPREHIYDLVLGVDLQSISND